MKNISVIIVGLSLFFYTMAGIANNSPDSQAGGQSGNSSANTVSIMSASELNSLANQWANEYGQLNPSTTITVGELSDQQSIAPNHLNLVTSDCSAILDNASNWKMVIGRAAVVAVFNAKNPMLNEIKSQGIDAEEFAQQLQHPEKGNWERVIKGGRNVPVHYYSIDNEKVKQAIAKFTATDVQSIQAMTTGTSAEVISAIQKDIYSIGFCNLTDVMDAQTNTLVQGISLLPIDKNKNGRIDNFESIYASLESFTRGVWIGKYPHALCGNIYAASATKPTDENTLAFLTWIITDGQKYLNTNGFSDLASTEVKSNMDVLAGHVTTAVATPPLTNPSSISGTWLIALAFIAVAVLLILWLVSYGRKQKWALQDNERGLVSEINTDKILAPKGLYFDKTHTWAFMEKDGNVKVGIDDFLQHITGTLTRIIMREPGEKVRKGEKILTIVRDGKQLNIYSPISGIIRQQNTLLLTDSTLINSSPFSEGWVYLVEPNNWVREIRFLFMGEKYKEWIEDEFARLKDFIAYTVRSNSMLNAQIVLQDGGELADHILADMEPEVWEDFQMKFINTSK